MSESEAAAAGVFPAAWVRLVEHRQALVNQSGLPPLAEAQLRRELPRRCWARSTTPTASITGGWATCPRGSSR